jgi:hypothetical protein
MFRQVRMSSIHWLTSAVAVVLLSLPLVAQQPKSDQSDAAWKPVEGALGRGGKMQPDGSFKFSMPRYAGKARFGSRVLGSVQRYSNERDGHGRSRARGV